MFGWFLNRNEEGEEYERRMMIQPCCGRRNDDESSISKRSLAHPTISAFMHVVYEAATLHAPSLRQPYHSPCPAKTISQP